MPVPPNQQDPLEQPESSTSDSAGPKTIEMAAEYGCHKGDSSMFCTACGTKNATDANYCKQCGRRLEHTAPIRITDEAFAEAGSPDEQVRAYLMRAYIRYEAGDLAGAIESCQKALGVQPDSTDAHSLLSTLYEKQGDRDKAIAEREIVLQLNPGSIADREKLEQLRDSSLIVTPLKITSVRHASTMLGTRAGAAIVAVTAALFVMVAGLAAVLVARNRPTTVQAQSQRPGGVSLPDVSGSTIVSNPQNASQTSGQRSVIQLPTNQTPIQNPATAQPNHRQAPLFSQNGDETPVRAVPPAVVQVPGDQNRFAPQDANSGRGSGGGTTVHLPDNGLAPSEIGPGPNGPSNPATQPGSQPTTPSATPPPNRGKIEIIVSSGGAGAVQPNNGPGRNADGSASTMDSRSAKRIAQDYQVKGQYKLAISSYIKALDGAGDDAAPIHYQIGLCYQRLDERENAIAQYNAAIGAYREQISAGHNVDSANRGIRAAESAIKACQ